MENTQLFNEKDISELVGGLEHFNTSYSFSPYLRKNPNGLPYFPEGQGSTITQFSEMAEFQGTDPQLMAVWVERW